MEDALATQDVEALTALYVEDATIESPLVRYLLATDEGVCVGRDAIRAFIPILFKHQPKERRTHKKSRLHGRTHDDVRVPAADIRG
jgi:hypothetical protein